jgi:hypothetical protein
MMLGNASRGDSAVNISVEIHQDLIKVPVYITFSIPTDSKDEDYSKIILKAPINMCRIVDGVAGDFISKMIGKELKKISNIPLKCPFPKGNYKFINFIMSDKFLPSYLFSQDIKYLANAKVMAKVANQKNLVLLFNVRSYGSISKD